MATMNMIKKAFKLLTLLAKVNVAHSEKLILQYARDNFYS